MKGDLRFIHIYVHSETDTFWSTILSLIPIMLQRKLHRKFSGVWEHVQNYMYVEYQPHCLSQYLLDLVPKGLGLGYANDWERTHMYLYMERIYVRRGHTYLYMERTYVPIYGEDMHTYIWRGHMYLYMKRTYVPIYGEDIRTYIWRGHTYIGTYVLFIYRYVCPLHI